MRLNMRASIVWLTALLILPVALQAQKPRERELKLPIGGTPGALDAITDVAGVEVGHTTLVSGTGKLVVGTGPVRTGVTVIHPRGKANSDPVFAAWFTLNGNGEMTGTTWVQESGMLEGPVAITNTHSVGVVRDAIIQWEVAQKNALQPWWLPVVAETYDGGLNDINGFHVKPEHVLAALDGASAGLPREGVVGGGTGMVCHGFKGGVGTASRAVGGYVVGVLVQANYGRRRRFRVDGVPVGQLIGDRIPGPTRGDESGSIIGIVATDAPLLPHQCDRLAQRTGLGVGRMGGTAAHSSGDLFFAFATGNRELASEGVIPLEMLSDLELTPFYDAVIESTEEAILNALLAAETMTGRDGNTVHALEPELLVEALRQA